MVDNRSESNYQSYQESSTRLFVKSIVITYIPIFLIIANVLDFHNTVLGVISTTSFLVLNGHVVYEKLRSLLGEIKWIGIAIGAFIFFAGICVISSPFVLFSAFSLMHVAVIIGISGIPMVLLRIKYNLPITPIGLHNCS